MRKFLGFALFVCALTPQTGRALDAWYLGGQLGHVALTGPMAAGRSNAIGFGVDLGMRSNPVLDINVSLQSSSHSGTGGLTLYSAVASADLRLLDVNDFEVFFGGGPGFYFFKGLGTTESKFGLNFGLFGNVMVDENIRIGLGTKYHYVFNSSVNADNFWTVTMRFGYLFDMGGA